MNDKFIFFNIQLKMINIYQQLKKQQNNESYCF